jgi:hypothetical protein
VQIQKVASKIAHFFRLSFFFKFLLQPYVALHVTALPPAPRDPATILRSLYGTHLSI